MSFLMIPIDSTNQNTNACHHLGFRRLTPKIFNHLYLLSLTSIVFLNCVIVKNAHRLQNLIIYTCI